MIRTTTVATLACAGLLVSGCSDDGTPGTVASESASTQPTESSPSPTPSVDLQPLGERCGQTAQQDATTARVVKGSGDVQLYGVGAGSGRLGVVLVHGSGSRGVCNWAGEIGWLAKAGLNVVGYDQSCVGSSTCAGDVRPVEDLLAVVGDLRRRGATKVVVVGASAGGSLPLVAAVRPDSGIAAVVSLSPANVAMPIGTADAPDATALSVARSVRQPVLYALAQDDTASTVAEMRSLSTATKGSRLVLLPAGSGHAQEVLYDTTGQKPSAFRQTFLTFLRAV
nr:alpha/beta fold hydrolase [Kribbella italica]